MSYFVATQDQLDRARSEAAQWQESYEYLRDVIIAELNPRDGDEAEEFLMVQAVRYAAEFIRSLPCQCEPGTWANWDEACRRCDAIGRIEDKVADR